VRLEALFDRILVDEMQDLVGYDLDWLDAIIASHIDVLMVGDPRQSTYASNDCPKNKQYRGFGLYAWVEQRRKRGLLCYGHMNWSHRCNEGICRFADALFPEQPRTESRNVTPTSHDGVFLV
jgi:ATP-dependent DNA helicase UvrD/PcrA